jgi:hypothetical protein
MLETIREYAWEQLETHGETRNLQESHAAWCLALAEQAAPLWFTPDQTGWADRFDLESDNLQAALTWAANAGESDTGARLIGRLWPYWFIRGHIKTGRAWSEAGLQWTEGWQTIERIRILTAASCFTRAQGDEPRATALGEEARCLAETLGVAHGIDAVHALIGLALSAALRGDTAQATELNQSILDLLRDLEEVEPSAPAIASMILVNWAELMLDSGNTDHARQLVETALQHQQQHGFTWAKADSLLLLALLAHVHGQAEMAASYCRDSLTLGWTGHDPQQMTSGLNLLIQLASESDLHLDAARLLGVRHQLSEQLGVRWEQSGLAWGDTPEGRARAALDDIAYHHAWQAGCSQPLARAIPEAIALADSLAGRSERGNSPSPS